MYLLIDYERLQGSTDRERPFTRAPLHIRSVTGHLIVFSVGNQHFVGSLERDKLSVSLPGEPPVELRRLK